MWLHVPTSLCSAAPEASTWPSDSLCQMLSAYATWRTKSLPPASWRRVLKKEASMMRLSGLMCEPSQAQRSVEGWLESLADSRAPISALPAAKPESLERKAVSGSTTPVLFAKFNPDGSLSKTSHQSSMWETEEPYSENLPQWGSMRNGELFQQQPWEPRISEKGYSFWPTARAEDPESCGNHPGATDSLTGAVKMWPTPQSADVNYDRGGEAYAEKQVTKSGYQTLACSVKMWATPNVPNGGRAMTAEDVENRDATVKGKRQVGLENQAKFWATPQSRDAKSPDPAESGNYKRKLEAGWTIDLGSQAANWPTPASRDYRTPNAVPDVIWRGTDKGQQLPNFVEAWDSSPPDPPTADGKNCWCGTHGCGLPSHQRKLNPIFAAWLMGWPHWWAAREPMPFARSAMALWLSRARQCLESF